MFTYQIILTYYTIWSFSILFINDNQSFTDFKEYLLEDKPEIIDYSETHIKTKDYEVQIDPKYKKILEFVKKDKYDPLIYGKDQTENIVSIECVDNDIWLFKADGTVETRPNKFWILADRKLDKNFVKLEGNNHYKYIRTFNDREKYYKYRNIYNKKDIYVIWDDAEAAMTFQGITLFKEMKLDGVSVLSFDIEADGLVQHENSHVFVITNTFSKDGKQITKQFRADHYENEGLMIDEWCDWVREVNPDILTGHNIFGFDFPYLTHVASLHGTKLYLGRNGSEINIPRKPRKYRVDGSQTWDFINYKIFGRSIIDGMFLAVKYDIGKNYESWGLKSIIKHEGLIAEGRQFYDASKIGKDWWDLEKRELIVKYCIDDGNDSLSIFNLMIPSFFYMAQSIRKPLQTIINGASGAWLNSILVGNYLQDFHSIPKANESEYVAGGMSYGVPGVYNNVIKFDAKSFYPSTILAFDITDKQKDPKGYYTKMVKHFTHKRFEQKDMYKKTGEKHYDDLQASSKIFINSAYGLLGTRGLNFNSYENASLITKCCRAGLQKAVVWATNKDIDFWWSEYKEKETSTQDFEDYSFIDKKAEISFSEMERNNWKLVNIDTDALSFCKQDESPYTELEKREIQDYLNKIMYSEWEDDGCFEKLLVLKAKNYVMKEGEKIKMKGSSILDQKKEPALQEMLKKILVDSLIHETEDYVEIYHNYVREALDIEDIHRWASKKSITETLLKSDRRNETKVVDALEGLDYQIGDKVYLFQDIDGERQKIVKGEPVFKKDGTPTMIDNDVYKRVEQFDGSYDKWHYVKRVYNTINILAPVIDMERIEKFHLKSRRKLVEKL